MQFGGRVDLADALEPRVDGVARRLLALLPDCPGDLSEELSGITLVDSGSTEDWDLRALLRPEGELLVQADVRLPDLIRSLIAYVVGTRNEIANAYARSLPLSRKAERYLGLLHFRRLILEKTAAVVVARQLAYLRRGTPEPNPLLMTEVAATTGFSVSTVSRAVLAKRLLFEGKVFAMRELFDIAVLTPAGPVARRTVRRMILSILERDGGRHLSDESIRNELQQLGVSIARRTVNKFRNELGVGRTNKRRVAPDSSSVAPLVQQHDTLRLWQEKSDVDLRSSSAEDGRS